MLLVPSRCHDDQVCFGTQVRELEEQLGTLKSAQDANNQMRAYMRDENTALISR